MDNTAPSLYEKDLNLGFRVRDLGFRVYRKDNGICTHIRYPELEALQREPAQNSQKAEA